jgi:hypothetical protein
MRSLPSGWDEEAKDGGGNVAPIDKNGQLRFHTPLGMLAGAANRKYGVLRVEWCFAECDGCDHGNVERLSFDFFLRFFPSTTFVPAIAFVILK